MSTAEWFNLIDWAAVDVRLRDMRTVVSAILRDDDIEKRSSLMLSYFWEAPHGSDEGPREPTPILVRLMICIAPRLPPRLRWIAVGFIDAYTAGGEFETYSAAEKEWLRVSFLEIVLGFSMLEGYLYEASVAGDYENARACLAILSRTPAVAPWLTERVQEVGKDAATRMPSLQPLLEEYLWHPAEFLRISPG